MQTGSSGRAAGALPEAAEVVVVGGGVIGASVAFHLAEAGVRDVVLIERDALGSGSTGKAAGGIRAQFSDELNIRIARRSLDRFAEFAVRPGAEIDLARVGYLFLIDDANTAAQFERGIALQNELGVPSRLLTAEQAVERSPLIDTTGIVAAAFCPLDGHATPDAVVQGYANAARRLDARIVTNCELLDVEVVDGAVRRVLTTRGEIEAGTVICAAGAWSRQVGAMAGVSLPVTPLRRQIVFTEAIPTLPRCLPMTIDFATSFYFHREGPGLLLGMSDPDEVPGFRLERDDAWLERLLAAAQRRAPRIAEAGVRGGWAGLYEMTPDHNALIGEAAGVSRFLYATGFSGHGFLQGPAVGEIIRDLYLGAAPFVDVGPLSAERFAREQIRPELNVV